MSSAEDAELIDAASSDNKFASNDESSDTSEGAYSCLSGEEERRCIPELSADGSRTGVLAEMGSWTGFLCAGGSGG